ncbi:MAG TPA: retropepsin-like aspartic protease [Pyrinomonadaceae bacterium]|nr:retropepsin-like aspartic protease [Pyrinomonadaceae bacterium]
MKFKFKADYGLVYVRVKVGFADKEFILNLALDTGASGTIISAKKLREVGYDLDNPEDEIYITTGSGLIFVPKITIEKLTALGKEVSDFVVIAHDFPPTSSVDGVLGLDFLRESILTVDFVEGEIELI